MLVLTSDTGAGHRSVSRALAAGARERAGIDLEVIDLDPFLPLPPALRGSESEDRSSPLDRIVRLYGPVIVRAPWLWGWGFRASDNRPALAAYLAAAGPRVGRRIAQAIRTLDADAVVSVHPLVNHLMARVRNRLSRPSLPLMTVVTDLVDVHRWWAAPQVDRYVVGSDLAAGHLYDLGIAPQKVSVVGIPLRQEFGQVNQSAREMRAQLGLDPANPTVLLMGGGEGAGQLVPTARAFAALAGGGVAAFQMVVVAGRNQRARAALQAQPWPVQVQVHGLLSNVAAYMTAADVVVTKPGSLTVSEALAVGRPLLLGRPIPGQEEGNVPFVVKAGAGLAYRSPAEAAEAVAYLLGDPSARWEMSMRAARLGRPRATERTLDILQSLLLRAEVIR